MEKKQVTTKKTGKKSFFEISAPITSTKIQLQAKEKEDLVGRTIKIDLTKILRGKNIEMKMRVNLSENKLTAEPESLVLLNSYIRKIMRKSVDYVEDSFQTNSKDKMVVIKPFLITRARVSRTIIKVLRENARKFLETYIKARSSQEIFSEVITNKLQKQLSLKLKKTYPLALCEIRVLEVVRKKE